MPALHDHLTHLCQYLRAQQTDIVNHRLALVPRIVRDRSVTQKLTDRLVLVDQLVDAIIILPQTLQQNARDQNPPQVHARTAYRLIILRQQRLLKQSEQSPACFLIGV